MRHSSDGCPHCHAPAPAEPVSTTRFRAWLLCLSCGHVWAVSRLALAFRACTGRRRPIAVQQVAAEDTSVLATSEGTRAGSEMDPALESWLAEVEPSSKGGQGWSSVNTWLDSDPLPIAVAARDRAVEEEWGLARQPEPARPAPKTLMERLDALYEGMLQLERFVAKSAAVDDMLAAPKAPAPAVAAATPRRARPRLVVSRKEKPHAA